MPDRPCARVSRDILELIPTYLDARRDDVARARAGLDADHLSLVTRIGHRMKGSGASYGFPDISRIGAGLEAAGRAGDLHDCERWLNSLARYVDTVEVVPA
jgi:HPt (histidine-containing phosphotransfer) domain-containing protein